MDFILNNEELALLYGLPHIQQLTYLRGIRPYMDIKTGLVGIKRRISYQSISEQLYVEPHQGIKSQNFSRDQLRRAVSGLARVGVITVQSEGMQLILKCELASRDYSVQNKAAINQPLKPTTNPNQINLIDTRISQVEAQQADTVKSSKPATPLISKNIYVYLLEHFKQFWEIYPLKNSKPKVWQVFQELAPSEQLIAQILNALENQIRHVQRQQTLGRWVANWKNPANWLAQQCWNDVIPTEQQLQDNQHANKINSRKQQILSGTCANQTVKNQKIQAVMSSSSQEKCLSLKDVDELFLRFATFYILYYLEGLGQFYILKFDDF